MKAIAPYYRRFWLALCFALASIVGEQESQAANAKPPVQMSYQGHLVDANGTPLGNTNPRNYDAVFRIYDASQGGALLWAERQTITVDKGYFSVLLGEGSANGSDPRPSLPGVFSGSTSSDRYMGITVEGLAASNVEIAPRLRLLTSPYAFLSQYAVSLVSSASGSEILTTSSSGITVAGSVSATSLSGNGSSLTALNASSVSSGTINDARLSSNVPLKNANQTFSGANTFNNLNNQLAGNGSGIHHLNAGELTSGTVPDGRLSVNAKLPPGLVLPFAGTGMPSGWLHCNGAAVSRTTYSDLFSAIGTTYGAGDGSTTFNLPNLLGRIPVGKDTSSEFNTLGKTGGEKNHTLTVSEIPSHYHFLVPDHSSVTLFGDDSGDLMDHGDSGGVVSKDPRYSRTRTENEGSDGAHNNLQPYITLNYIIKY